MTKHTKNTVFILMSNFYILRNNNYSDVSKINILIIKYVTCFCIISTNFCTMVYRNGKI